MDYNSIAQIAKQRQIHLASDNEPGRGSEVGFQTTSEKITFPKGG